MFGRYDTYRADGSYERTDDKWQNSGSIRRDYYLPWDEVSRANPFQWAGSSTERWVFNSNGEINYRNVSGTGDWSWTGTVYRYQTRSVNKVYTTGTENQFMVRGLSGAHLELVNPQQDRLRQNKIMYMNNTRK